MIPKLGPSIDHYWLALRMAKATGLDLASAFKASDLTQEDWAHMVHRCRGCAWTEGCSKFLTRQDPAQTEPVHSIPPQCRNADQFEALRAGPHNFPA